MNKNTLKIFGVILGIISTIAAIAVLIYIFRDKINEKLYAMREKFNNKKILTSEDFEDFDAPEEISFDDFVTEEDIEDLNKLDGVEENIITTRNNLMLPHFGSIFYRRNKNESQKSRYTCSRPWNKGSPRLKSCS
ncbi:MAG: hypothetical protein IKZ25_02305 [Clostridia bacterium]|nr:hypothetical protein [Clostridia bacterium]